MAALHFTQPLHLVTGIGMPIEIRSVEHAFAFLNDWPPRRRDYAHRLALKACRAALAGEVDAETARTMVKAFAERCSALADAEALPVANFTIPPHRPSNIVELRV